MKRILLICLATITACECLSQDLPDLKVYHSDIGFNTNFVFSGIFNSGGRGTPFDLMIKKQKTANAAFRFGVGLNLSNYNDLNSYYQQGYTKYSNYFLSVSLGKEFQKQINKRWIFYYGADLAPFLDLNQGKRYYQNNPPNLTYYLQSQNNSNIYGLRVIPFIGIRFTINDRLYLATQTNLTFLLNKKDAYQKTLDTNNSTSGNYQYISSSKSFYENSLTVTAASGIFFFYRF